MKTPFHALIRSERKYPIVAVGEFTTGPVACNSLSGLDQDWSLIVDAGDIHHNSDHLGYAIHVSPYHRSWSTWTRAGNPKLQRAVTFGDGVRTTTHSHTKAPVTDGGIVGRNYQRSPFLRQL